MNAINTFIMVLYYIISAFFLAAMVRNFLRTKNIQESILYGVMMIPFVLRILRLK